MNLVSTSRGIWIGTGIGYLFGKLEKMLEAKL